jgi:DnaJ-class molecular chaperone
MTCECVKCPTCYGSGNIWVDSLTGHYVGSHRRDDLDEMEICPQCGGSGVEELCEECFGDPKEDEEEMP